MNEQKKKGSAVKKILVGFLAVALIVGTTIAGTLAYLSTITDTVQNTFTASGDIKLALEEVNYNFKAGSVLSEEDPNPSKYTPGTTYEKDPVLINTTGDNESEEWVAMRVDYKIDGNVVANNDLTGDSGIIDPITFDSNWIKVTPSTFGASDGLYEIYVYKYKLTKSSSTPEIPAYGAPYTYNASTADVLDIRTTPLFSSIRVVDQDRLASRNHQSPYPTFSIDVKGAAIKNEAESTFKTIDSNDFGNTDTNSYKIVDALVDLLANKNQ